ncbi:MAG: thioredoxin family protein [Paludibacteraceae bacterium]|nr:thioredoxin family protein [Paludibacteraceae bacterium]
MRLDVLTMLFVLLISPAVSMAEIQRPVKWRSSVVRIDDGRVQAKIIAKIDSGWHVYGTVIPEGGPVATEFNVKSVSGGKPDGKVQISERGLMSGYDDVFMMHIDWYENRMEFTQNFIVTDSLPFDAVITVRYMCCNDESCLPPTTENFTLHLDALADASAKPESESAVTPVAEDDANGHVTSGSMVYWAQDENGEWVEKQFPSYWFSENAEDDRTEANTVLGKYGWRYLLMVFLAGVVAGLLSILTPCVWPVIPMTVGFFLKKGGGKRDAILYGVSIFLIYMILGMVITVLFGADSLNGLATNAWINIALFVILIAFALSFVGLFEIELPSSWSNALNKQAESHKGGYLGILFMASVLVIVSFSCTGPIVGTLLVELAVGDSILNPLIGMSGFALAIGLPFAVFAMFPRWMNSLPKSGSWMETIKYFLAAVECLFALKFLSVADLTMGWGILPRWLMITLWGVIGLALAVIMLRKVIKERHLQNMKWGRGIDLFVLILSLCFSCYMFTGFFGNNLKEVSAFMPPMESEAEVYTDLDSGYEAAKLYDKPVFIDFTGWGCVNCRKMEGKVMTDEKVKEAMSKYVVVRLYVDDREELPSALKVEENGDSLVIATVGEKWSWFERVRYNANTQPLYVLTDTDGNMLNVTYSYDEDIEKFIDWLNAGLKNFTDK